MLLPLPRTIIAQWIDEIKSYWPGLVPVLSYGSLDLRKRLPGFYLTGTAMRKFRVTRTQPEIVQNLWKKKQSSRRCIVITTYDTHKRRTLKPVKVAHPGVSFNPRRFKSNGQEIFKEEPWEEEKLDTTHRGRFSLLIADEAHKVKNKHTEIWQLLIAQRFEKVLLSTATPMFNSVDDLIGLVGLLGERTIRELKATRELDKVPSMSYKARTELCSKLASLDRLDPARKILLNPDALNRVLGIQQGKYTAVANYFNLVMNLVAIQRGPASSLPRSNGDSILMKDLLKKVKYFTRRIGLHPTEIQEYQKWHQDAATTYAEELKKLARRPKEMGPEKGKPKISLTSSRQLALLCFSTLGGRLDRMLVNRGSNTHIDELAKFRSKNRGVEWIHYMVRSPDEIQTPTRTAVEELKYMVKGSPVLRLILQEILDVKALEPLNKERWGHHQKLLIGESHPFNAWFLEVVLRFALVDARVFHSKLSNEERMQLMTQFNDPNSSLKVLIMTYDTGGVGLNLHHACDRVFIASAGLSRAQEQQLAGRCLRVTSEFPLKVIRRYVKNSHDGYRSSRQCEKAALQLAVNSRNKEIQEVIVMLPNEIQPEVNECHQSEEGQALIAQVKLNLHEFQSMETRALGSPGPSKRVPPSSGGGLPDLDAPEAEQEQSDLELQSHGDPDGSGETTREVQDPETSIESLLAKYSSPMATRDTEEDKPFSTTDDPETVSTNPAADDTDADDSEEEESDDDDGKSLDLDDDIKQHPSSSTNRPSTDNSAQNDTLFDKRIQRLEWEQNLNEYARVNQPDEHTCHMLALLNMPPNKVWTVRDLEDDHFLRIGLLLLYNKIVGMETLMLRRSIHIDYSEISCD